MSLCKLLIFAECPLKAQIFKQLLKIFNPYAMTINLQRISLTSAKLQFIYHSVQGGLCDLIKYFRPFSVILQPVKFL